MCYFFERPASVTSIVGGGGFFVFGLASLMYMKMAEIDDNLLFLNGILLSSVGLMAAMSGSFALGLSSDDSDELEYDLESSSSTPPDLSIAARIT